MKLPVHPEPRQSTSGINEVATVMADNACGRQRVDEAGYEPFP
jgi:hypothetical protein